MTTAVYAARGAPSRPAVWRWQKRYVEAGVEGLLREATRIAHAVAEVTNVPPASRQPYVGVSAFARPW